MADDGTRYWGRFGAAGLLAVDAERGILLQHRVAWSHFGDTWGLPGGARHQEESACDAALREAAEEAGVPGGAVRPHLISVLDVGIWTYSTLVADVVVPFEPVISDPESRELAWVPLDRVDDLPLHPGFAAAWPVLRGLLAVRSVVVVDAANVVGSVPDGWWKDRAGATARLLQRLHPLAAEGVPGRALGLADVTWFPPFRVVVEGQARAVEDPVGAADTTGSVAPAASAEVSVVRAPGEGDDEIVAETERLVAAGNVVTVVTSDRGLRERVVTLGATVHGPSWLGAW